jgi:hypothetical protein
VEVQLSLQRKIDHGQGDVEAKEVEDQAQRLELLMAT